MKKILLNDNWKFKIVGKDSFLTGDGLGVSVPGSVYSALLDYGLIDDPYFADNELKVLPVMDNDFEFTKEFTLDEENFHCDALLLRFDGIDTLAEIYVNDVLIGNSSDMHCYYEFDLLKERDDFGRPVAHEGNNRLRVFIKSPTKYIKAENAKSYTGGSAEAMEGFPHLRKAHCMFGWDWGPRIPDAGIWRDVSILMIDSARIESVYIHQEHIFTKDGEADREKGMQLPCEVNLRFDVRKQYFSDKTADVNITVYSPDGEVCSQSDENDCAVVCNPQLWWPVGYGSQPLYTCEISLSNDKKEILDSKTVRIGLRTLTVNTDSDECGECFAHEVNGVKIFAMGADYIPEDNIFCRINKDRTRRLLEDAVWANHNSIRVWGGGYYPDDWFFDICDELGLIVWQDFMFACAAYDLTPEFEKDIECEITQNVRRIANHACLGVLCGNNELETQVLDGAWKHTLRQKADYLKMFEYIIPKIVGKEAPDIFYWPSSPSSCGSFDNPWDENRGDTHYWAVWHGERPFTDFRKYHFRYLSEFGFQSFPCLDTVRKFAEEDEFNIFSRTMEMHQRNRSANGKIMKYMSETYLYPSRFEMLLYASQLLQADAIRYGVEHFRRNRGRCMGAVVWQLNDIWPTASWSSIDYYGNYKALHYTERRAFSPLMISCEETGEITERPSCIIEPKQISKGAKIHVANETISDSVGTVRWSLRNPDSSVVMEGTQDVLVPKLGGVWLDYLNFDEYDERRMHLTYSYETGGVVVSQNSVLFTPPKHYYFNNPGLRYEVSGDSITVYSDCYAKNVCIEPLDGKTVFEDNFFDMEKGSKTIKIMSNNATEFSLKSVWNIAND